MSVNKTLLIAKQELKYLLHAPLAWTVLGVTLAVMAWIFLAQIEAFQQIAHELMNLPKSPGVTGFVITPLYSTASIILMMIIPLLAMNSFHRERWGGRMSLLAAAPVTSSNIVLGKFIGLAVFLALMLGLISLMPLSLKLGAPIDLNTVLINSFGLWLLLIAFTAITLYLGCVSKEPVITLSLSIGVLLLLWLVDWSSHTSMSESIAARYVSIMKHYQNLLKARINTSDLIYFISLIGLFLALSIRHLDNERERL
jgi:ABC-2 type transport system permease protein